MHIKCAACVNQNTSLQSLTVDTHANLVYMHVRLYMYSYIINYYIDKHGIYAAIVQFDWFRVFSVAHAYEVSRLNYHAHL